MVQPLFHWTIYFYIDRNEVVHSSSKLCRRLVLVRYLKQRKMFICKTKSHSVLWGSFKGYSINEQSI